ncbi:MAG: 1,4-alpha-glucan branching protein GlgB [Thomasclavelia sp.]|nr:1,4-alpha-glucan branching protein GlgB [Thomasclavelia sp.]
MFDDFLIHTFHDGNCLQAYKIFGAHLVTENKKKGCRFTVFAPNAKSVEVVGDFNNWEGQNHVMEKYNDGGIWTLFIPGIKQYDVYKYKIETQKGDYLYKADPYAFFSELRPATASKVFDIEGYKWKDNKWLDSRTKNFDRPLNIYEVNIGSWKMKKDFTDEEDGEFYSYEELIDKIIPYTKEMGYTHLEVMPLNEFPFDGSWGYQPTGFYSATSRYGNPKQLMHFIDACHKEGVGIILDFVPAHFVKDEHGLHMFDGGFVYDYDDFNRRYSPWDSVYFDLGKNEVRSFLLSCVDFFATYFHVDGFRFDAVSNLIYYEGNKNLGVNIGAQEFLKRLNGHMLGYHPNVMMIAEDSTDAPKVTKPVGENGLGFDYKWDLGWMNDTLKYFAMDPYMRKFNHKLITFSMAYFHSENFLMEFSHDEVVHGKATIINKMWGLAGDKMAQAKALYVYMFTHPGKKLNFMGNELGEYKEWDEKKSLGWNILDYPDHDAFHHFCKDLNHIYNSVPALYECDYKDMGFEWLVVDDEEQSVFAFVRRDKNGGSVVVVLNFIGNEHEVYNVPVYSKGSFKEILNTDKDIYAGHNITNPRKINTKKDKTTGKYYVPIKIAPFSAMIFEYNIDKTEKKTTKKKVVKKKAVKKNTKSKG